MSFAYANQKIFEILFFCFVLNFVQSLCASSYIPEVTITPSYLDQQIGLGKQQTFEACQQQQKESLYENLKNVPGLKISSYGSRSIQNYVTLRGANTEHTAVRIFGLKLNDVANGGRFDFSNIPSSDIKLTNVSNFSSDSTIGGVIDLIPQQGYGDFHTTLDLEGGSYNTTRMHGSMSGSTQKSDYYVSSHFSKSGAGYLKNQRLKNTLADRNLNTSLTTRLGHAIIPNWHMDLYTFHNQIFTKENTIFQNLPIQSDNHATYRRHFFVINNHFKTLDHRWDHDIVAGYIQNNYRQFFKSNTSSYFNQGQSLKGAYNTKLKFHLHQHLLTSIGITKDLTQQQDIKRHPLKSYHSQLTYLNDLIPNLVLEVSGRLDKHDFYKIHPTYFGSARYYFNSQLMTFVKYGTGFEMPTAFDFYKSSSLSVDNLSLKPVRSQNFEIGIQAKPWDVTTFSLSYFRTHIHDILMTIKNNQGQYQRINAEARSVQGLEGNLRLQLSQDLQWRAGYTLTNAKDQPSNLPSVRISRHQLHTGVDYIYQEKTTFFTELSYQSPTKDIDFYHTPVKRVLLPSTTNLRLGGAYKLDNHLEITARIENIFGRQPEHIYGFAGYGREIYIGVRLKS